MEKYSTQNHGGSQDDRWKNCIGEFLKNYYFKG